MLSVFVRHVCADMPPPALSSLSLSLFPYLSLFPSLSLSSALPLRTRP